MTPLELKKLESEILARGLPEEARKRIRNAKICIIDDKVGQLKSMVEGLQKEGFSNIVKLQQIESVNSLLNSDYDVIVLDLSGVATSIDDDDGLGVLQKLKQADPSLPVIVVTGNEISPRLVKTAGLSDLVRHKPVLSADLAADVEAVLRPRVDPRLGGIEIVRVIGRLVDEGHLKMTFIDRVRYRTARRKLLAEVRSPAGAPIDMIVKIAGILTNYATVAAALLKLCYALSGGSK
jgi:DNA-binding response OmpR family regulator